MASQETQEKGGGVGKEEGVAVEKERTPGGVSTAAEASAEWPDSRRIGPWHPPDYQRQKALADRLSNSALRSSRPATSPQDTQQPPYLSLQHSPYNRHPSSPAATAIGTRRGYNTINTKMNSSRSSSGPLSSPRVGSSPRRQASSASLRYGAVSPRRQPPLFPTPATSRRVTEDELDGIVERITKPTVSSRGGVDLQDKDFTYIQTPRLKTLPVVPGLDRRYLGLQRVDSARMDEIVLRLTRMTSAYKAKFARNKNVYVDMEPGAHMVSPQRSAQSAV
ncbi:hypothetical protein ACOMHN_016655 [Nucella lapillus]